jgi:hypothetical protein
MKKSGLYFILNPMVGIIKIGIARDVMQRLNSLEMGGGVSLELLRVVPGAEHYERDLHLALDAYRLRGEWFAPSEEMMALIDGDEPIASFLARVADRIAGIVAVKRAAVDAARTERNSLAESERANAARIDAERLRIEQARELRAKRMRGGKPLAQTPTEQSKRLSGVPALVRDRVIDTRRASEAEQRRALIAQQRARNAAKVGVVRAEVAGA